jgi:hypothetical protein
LHKGSYDCSDSIWADCGCDEYMNAAGADIAVAAWAHWPCAVPDRVPYLLALFLLPFHLYLLAWAAQPADDDSSCRLGVYEAAANLTTTSEKHSVVTRF